MSSSFHTTLTSFDMDRPLNKAHRHERIGEAQLKKQNWDGAEKSYSQAAEMMRKALEEVSSTSMTLPLQIQVENLEKIKDTIDIKRKEAVSFEKPDEDSDLLLESEPKSAKGVIHPVAKNSSPDKSVSHKNSFDRGTETSQVNKTNEKYAKKTSLPNNTWQMVPKNILQMVQERETDSLLQFLNLPMDADADQDLTSSTMSKKKPKSQEAKIEEYKTRLSLMQTTAIALMKALDDTERENISLKAQVGELRNEVSTLNQALEKFEENQVYQPLYFQADHGPTTQEFASDMVASMLIDQPESYFEFDGKDVESELSDATRDYDRQWKSSPPNHRGSTKRVDPDTSVQYEDLDDALNSENADFSESNSAGPSSLAGLPPAVP